MAIWDLFSKREKRKKNQGKEDVFQYDNLPNPFLVQVIHLWVYGLGAWHQSQYLPTSRHAPNVWWMQRFKLFTREKGTFSLGEESLNPFAQCQQYLQRAGTEDALDLIEVTFRFIDRVARQADYRTREM